MPPSLDPCKSDSDSSDRPHREPLAVIGIGCRLPGGIDSPTAFWDALLKGFDAICDVPDDRWIHSRFHDTHPEKSGVIRNAKGGFIKGVDLFDGEFFGYFPAAAQRIDPQQRLLLEVTHEAMEDAGLRRDQFDSSRTAVFIGSFMYDYLCMQAASEQRDEVGSHTVMGTALCSLANRISYDFNLKGPSVTLDTACSSSLTALHLACQSVWGGEAEMAVAGGVSLILRPEPSIMLSKGGFLNPDQYCKAFDAAANGYVRGEGVGAVILKPLNKALADGDSIYACVRGTAANQDGYLAEGYTVPNVVSQVELLEKVYADAGIDPSTVDFVEAHGTGTPVGDPVETTALGSVLGCGRSEEQPNLMIGSVKTNVGHLEGASGIAGFIKGVLTARHGIAPPNLHFNNPNPAIRWEYYRLEVPTEATPLVSNESPLTVGVNSFGAGGANAHVVLQNLAYESAKGLSSPSVGGQSISRNGRTSIATLYVLSATNRESLRTLALRHADFLSDTRHPLDDVAYSAFARRSHYSHLMAVVGETAKGIEDKLRKFADGQVDPLTLTATVPHKKDPRLAFVFSGQGGQWARMGLQWMQRESVFRQSMEAIDELFGDLAGWSLLDELGKEEGDSRVNDTVVVQPAVMALQISLVKLYEHYGIRASGAVGHSIGEVAAGFAAGALTLEQAVQVIYHRSQAQNQASGKGGMLAAALTLPDASDLIEGFDGVSISAVNGPEMLTLSGDTVPLEQIAQMLTIRGIFNRSVNVQVAYHSHHMEPIKQTMLASLAHVKGNQAKIPLYSTVSGDQQDGGHLTGDYWYQNVREPVLFTDALTQMVKDGFDTFVEIGPHPVLVRGGEALIQKLDADAVMVPSMTRNEPEVTVFLQSLARLAARGLRPDTDVMFGSGRHFVRLPKNPWQHQRYWFESPAAAEIRRGPYAHPFLKRQTQLATEEGLAVWDASLDVSKFPYFRDHQVDGETVFPGTGHLELAWAVASEQFRHESFFLENLRFEVPLMFPAHGRHPLDVRLEIISSEGDYQICSRPADASRDTPWSRHSQGRINRMHDQFCQSNASISDLQNRFQNTEPHSVEQFYEQLRAAGLYYGECFRCVEELRHNELQRHSHEWFARLRLSEQLVHEATRTKIHPALLDACLHVMFADVHRAGDSARIYLPYGIDRVRVYRSPTQQVWSHVRITRLDETYLCADTSVFDDAGELVAEVDGLVCKRLVGAGSGQIDMLYEGCFEYQWIPTANDADGLGRMSDCKHAVLIADEIGITTELARRFAAENIQPSIIASSDPKTIDEQLSGVPLDRRTLILFASGLSRCRLAWKGLAEYPAVASLLRLVQTLHNRDGVPRLFVTTNGAAGVEGDQHLDLGQAVLHGMSRVIKNECPNVPVTVVDLSAAMIPCEVDALYRELLHTRHDLDESEIALRGEQRFVRQLVSIEREIAEQSAITDEEGIGGSYRAEANDAGVLDQVVFRRLPPAELGDEDVELEVEAAALNFKDVVNAMGILPQNAVAGGLAGNRLGFEVAGRILRVGCRVKHLRYGDFVIARVADGFSGRAITPAHCVALRPSQLTPQQAAAVLVVNITAWYSLCHLARMERGETVLIHSAAGGVGSAAIQLAHRAGATVIATAGTKEKREHLRQTGIEHVFDSRSLDFYNRVMEATRRRGVDIVLNSLTGRFITQSMKCLAPFGRFVEIGKLDIYRNHKLGLQRLGENISYYVVDVDRLAAQKPTLHQQVMREVIGLFERGELQPPEITEYPISKLPEALRFMTRATHRGKIVLNMRHERVSTLPPRGLTLRANRSYLISGGATGFGLEIARWMVDRGARHLVLVSRSGCKTAADEAVVDDMKERGVEIVMVKADITDADAVRRLIDQIQQHSHPLAGVVHGAAVLDDASIPAMDMARFARAFNPKAQGAWNLHEATSAAGAELDFFLMLSSISSVLGLIGQVNYAAANYFQDTLAQYRRQCGLRATSINLGVLGKYAGMSNVDSDQLDVVSLLQSQGMYVMPLGDVLAKLETALIQQPVQRMTAALDWPWFRMAYPTLARDARFIELMNDAALARALGPKGTGLRKELAEMDPGERLIRLQRELAGSLARILDADAERIDIAASFDNFGFDSLMLTEFQVSIVRSLNVNVPLIKLLKGPSIASLSAELLTQLDGDSPVESIAIDDSQADTAFLLGEVEGIKILSPSLIRGRGEVEMPTRLICFHSMGVGASLFTNFLLNPPDGCEILAVQTPGRENRSDEPIAQSVDHLVDQIVPELLALFDRPVVIWGHSFGGIVAREVICRLCERENCEPAHFVVTGTIAPHLIGSWQNRDAILKSTIAENTPEYLMSLSRYVDDPAFLRAILPGLRRDYPLLKSYRYQETAPLKCPITAFAARQDEVVYTDEVAQWAAHTGGRFELIEVDGDHWFINRNRELIDTTLQEIATALLARQPDQAVGSH